MSLSPKIFRDIQHGIKSPIKLESYRKLLFEAVRTGNLGLVKYLVENGVSLQDTMELNEAVIYGWPAIVRYLISRGYDLDETRYNDLTPLDIAIMKQDLAMVRLLVESGAYIYNENLEAALYSKNRDIIKYLVNVGEPEPWRLKEAMIIEDFTRSPY